MAGSQKSEIIDRYAARKGGCDRLLDTINFYALDEVIWMRYSLCPSTGRVCVHIEKCLGNEKMERRKRQQRLWEEMDPEHQLRLLEEKIRQLQLLKEKDMPRPSGLIMMEQQPLWQTVKIDGEAVYGHMKHEPWIFGNDLMIKTKVEYLVKHNFLIIIDNSDNTLLGISANTHSLSDEAKQDFEYKDEATVRQNNLKKSKNETRLSQDNLEINNEPTLSQDNVQINNQREHPISSDQTRGAPRHHSTLWKMLGRNLPMLTILMAVYVLSQHHILTTSIVGLFFIQMFANKIYCVFFDCKNDETIRNNYPVDLVRKAMGFLVPMMMIQMQLAAVVMWQFHETHLAHEPKLNELPSFVVLGLMTFHVLLQFTFHVIDFTRLLM